MNIKVFEIKDKKVVATEICYTTKALMNIMTVFSEKEAYMKVYNLLFYLYCPDPVRNPFLNVPETEKEEFLIKEFGIDFSTDEACFEEGKKFFEQIFTTPGRRFYLDCKIGVEKQGKYLRDSTITSGRDGNDSAYLSTLKAMAVINDQFAKVEKSYEAEISAAVRGGQQKSFDE